VGDAALATDPVFGIAFALQSAEWLVDETSDALGGGQELDAALRRYRRKFLLRLGPHHLQIADFSSGRKLRALERVTFRTAAVNPVVARAFSEVLARERSPLRLLDPRIAGRLLVSRRTRELPASKAWQLSPVQSNPVQTTQEPA
jgi:flavin-dependent dehydrogenase